MKIFKVNYSIGAMEKSDGIELAPESILKEIETIHLSEGLQRKKIKAVEINSDKSENPLDEITDNINFPDDELSIILGGDHSITYASFKAFKKIYKKSGMLILDAHPDCYENFKTPVHEDWLKFLIDEKIIESRNVMLAGIRAIESKELEYLNDMRISYVPMKHLFMNLEENCDALMEWCRNHENIYISIDIDVVDPAFAPGTGYPEPGGLSSREILYLIQRLKLLKNIKVLDIVEVNPKKDVNNITSRLAAKIVTEMY